MPKSTAIAKSQTAELVAIAKFIREQHPLVKIDFSNLTFRRFAIGCYLLRARAILPDPQPGPKTGGEDEALTFVKWKHREFPELATSTLYDYQSYATRAIEKFPALEGFDVNKNVSAAEREKVLEQLKQCVNGKDQTMFLRAMGEIPEATPAGGDRGGRRPKKDLVKSHAIEQQRATEFWNHICDEIDRENSLQSWKLVDGPLRDRIIRTMALGPEIKKWSNQ